MPDNQTEERVTVELMREEVETLLGYTDWSHVSPEAGEACDCPDCRVTRKLRTALTESNP